MFERARYRLTLLYIAIFAIVLGTFSVVFYFALSTVLRPTPDIDPDVPTAASQLAYAATIERIGTALLLADLVVVGIVGALAWLLATRTLRPIQEAHRRQRRFVADASHEMRTPIAGIRATAEGALEGHGSATELRSSLESIVGSTDRLARLTNDLLLLARADDRLLESRRDTFDLSVVVVEALEEVRRASPAGRPATVRLASDLLVAGDADEVRRAVANLRRQRRSVRRSRRHRAGHDQGIGWHRGRRGLRRWARDRCGRPAEDLRRVLSRPARRDRPGRKRPRAHHRAEHRGTEWREPVRHEQAGRGHDLPAQPAQAPRAGRRPRRQ